MFKIISPSTTCFIFMMVFTAFAHATPMSNFDDGTLQGWTAFEFGGVPFNGTVDHVASDGNPGGFLRVTDTGHPGNLSVAGPAEFHGDLSVYSGLAWDEFIYPNDQVTGGTEPILVGSDGTAYRGPRPLGATLEWRPRWISFIESEWTLWSPSGSMAFDDVLADATLLINLDVAIAPRPNLEAGIDNVRLVPEPTTFVIMASVGMMIIRRRRS